MKKIIILGLGNILKKDEGIGVALLEQLRKDERLKGIPGMEFIDGGTASYDALAEIKKDDCLIVIDAVKAGGPAGTVRAMKPGDLQEDMMIDVHQSGLQQTFKWLEMQGKLPETSIMAVEVDDTSWGEGISENLKKELPEIISKIILQIVPLIAGPPEGMAQA
ncbi:MAG: hydrogenase maturation protease [bacterium]